jgi:hypothetical protein
MWSAVRKRPTIKRLAQLVATHGNGFGLFLPLLR